MKEDNITQLVTFKIENEEYGIEILKVQEIIRMVEITKVPNANNYIEGIINLRGNVIPIINLRKRLNINTKDQTNQTRIIVINLEKSVVGFIVDSVSEVLRISNDIIENAPESINTEQAQYIKGVGKLEDRLLILLDLEKLFNNKKEE